MSAERLWLFFVFWMYGMGIITGVLLMELV